jgi:hypothetical protein
MHDMHENVCHAGMPDSIDSDNQQQQQQLAEPPVQKGQMPPKGV